MLSPLVSLPLRISLFVGIVLVFDGADRVFQWFHNDRANLFLLSGVSAFVSECEVNDNVNDIEFTTSSNLAPQILAPQLRSPTQSRIPVQILPNSGLDPNNDDNGDHNVNIPESAHAELVEAVASLARDNGGYCDAEKTKKHDEKRGISATARVALREKTERYFSNLHTVTSYGNDNQYGKSFNKDAHASESDDQSQHSEPLRTNVLTEAQQQKTTSEAEKLAAQAQHTTSEAEVLISPDFLIEQWVYTLCPDVVDYFKNNPLTNPFRAAFESPRSSRDYPNQTTHTAMTGVCMLQLFEVLAKRNKWEWMLYAGIPKCESKKETVRESDKCPMNVQCESESP
jgi:hypothetical protein